MPPEESLRVSADRANLRVSHESLGRSLEVPEADRASTRHFKNFIAVRMTVCLRPRIEVGFTA